MQNTIGGASAFLLSVPFVVRNKILTQLHASDHLTLRQVCRTTRDWIDFSSVVEHVPYTRILYHGCKTFTRFLNRRAPHIITHLCLETDSLEFLQDAYLQRFLQSHCVSITHLRVTRFFTCLSSQELQFYESFPNLISLELDKISISSLHDVPTTFPRNFKHLKVLKIGLVNALPEPPADDSYGATLIPFARQKPMGLYVWNLIKHCEQIQHLGYPRTSKYFFQAFVDGRGRGEFGVFCDYVRSSEGLKVCDFQNEQWPPDCRNALALLKLGHEVGLKFLNLNANQFQYVKISKLISMYGLPLETADRILSFKNFNCLVNERLVGVEKISLCSSQVNSMLDYSCLFNGPDQLPNLQEIEVVVDTGLSDEAETDVYQRAREFKDLRNLLSHFFYDTERILDQETHVRKYVNVKVLRIKFCCEVAVRRARPNDLPLDWIFGSVPGLKKLILSGWREHDDWNSIWGRVGNLEELVLEDCDQLDGESFRHADLKRITIKNCKLLDESIVEILEDEKNMIPCHFLQRNNEMTWIKC